MPDSERLTPPIQDCKLEKELASWIPLMMESFWLFCWLGDPFASEIVDDVVGRRKHLLPRHDFFGHIVQKLGIGLVILQ